MKKGLIFGALGVMALAFASCSDDTPAGYQDEKVDRDQTRYLSVALCNPTNYMSRAGEFEDGTAEESQVNTLYFVFYDGSGAPTGTPVQINKANLDSEFSSEGTPENVTKFWSAVLPVNMSQGENKPVYVMCYVNPINMEGLNTMTLSEIDAATRDAVVNNGLFAMSNSVFYGSNPITGQSNVRMMATPIVGDRLYTTEEEAKTGSAINIYVERYAAKLSLTMAPAAIKDYVVVTPDGEEASLEFTPTFWRPNAIDQNTYITKAFATGVTDPLIPATYAAMNEAFKNTGMAGETNNGQGLSGWNDAGNYRSYWACSPSYYANNYPQCSDDITDVVTYPLTDATKADYPYALKYFTYNEIQNESSTENNPIAWNATTGFSNTQYFYSRETTAAIESLRAENINNKAVPASIVIVGNYKLSTATNNSNFYLYGKMNGKDVYYTEANIEQALISNQNVIFTDNTGTTRATSTDLFVVEHPSKAVRTNTTTTEGVTTTTMQKVPGRLVTLQINPETTTPLYFYAGGSYQQITAANIDVANKLLWASASTAQKFANGLAFFSIPVRHLGWGKNVPDDKPLLSQPGGGRATMINWQNLRRGDLGIVRNHVYSYKVTAVDGLGIGLENPNQPIVPPMDPDNYYVSVQLNILAWRIVPEQEIVI